MRQRVALGITNALGHDSASTRPMTVRCLLGTLGLVPVALLVMLRKLAAAWVCGEAAPA